MWVIVDATGYQVSDDKCETRKEAESVLRSLRSYDKEQWRGCYVTRR